MQLTWRDISFSHIVQRFWEFSSNAATLGRLCLNWASKPVVYSVELFSRKVRVFICVSCKGLTAFYVLFVVKNIFPLIVQKGQGSFPFLGQVGVLFVELLEKLVALFYFSDGKLPKLPGKVIDYRQYTCCDA